MSFCNLVTLLSVIEVNTNKYYMSFCNLVKLLTLVEVESEIDHKNKVNLSKKYQHKQMVLVSV